MTSDVELAELPGGGRENIDVTAWTFLRAGALVMPAALVLAVSSVLVTAH